MIRPALLISTLANLAPVAAIAASLELPPGATQTARLTEPSGQVGLAIAPYQSGSVKQVFAEGVLRTEAWKLPANNRSTFQLMQQFRSQIETAGFEILLDCESANCGGFDFRYALDLMPEPEMHVDLGDYRYLSAHKTKGTEAEEFVSLVVSKSTDSGFVQLTTVGPATQDDDNLVVSTKSPSSAQQPTLVATGNVSDSLLTHGSAALEDLSFDTGSSKLGDDDFASLVELADFLNTHPEMTVALVGHTDSVGSLTGNMTLSKRRAASVLERLAARYNVSKRQMEAAGVGYLAPRASNLTDDGRTQNRRVEVILTSTR